MSKIDEMLDGEPSRDTEARLRRIGNEPGYGRQAIGLFRGPMGWLMWIMVIAQFVLLGNAIYAGWMLYSATDPVVALRWAVAAVVLVQIITFLRAFMGTHFEGNRVLREIRRVELRLIRLEHAVGDRLDDRSDATPAHDPRGRSDPESGHGADSETPAQ